MDVFEKTTEKFGKLSDTRTDSRTEDLAPCFSWSRYSGAVKPEKASDISHPGRERQRLSSFGVPPSVGAWVDIFYHVFFEAWIIATQGLMGPKIQRQ